MASILFLILEVLIMGILLVALSNYLDSREVLRQDREALEVRRRALETKCQLDAEAFRAARGIQDAIRRHGGSR